MYKDYKDLSMIIEYKDTLQVIIAYTLKNTLCSYLYVYVCACHKNWLKIVKNLIPLKTYSSMTQEII